MEFELRTSDSSAKLPASELSAAAAAAAAAESGQRCIREGLGA